MQGKLVEQDPNDESVEVLLEKIRAEKQKLFEEGKIKKKDLDISIVSQEPLILYMKSQKHGDILNLLA
ncbi:type I restriction-modification system subunit S [Streptococcus pneumoniae]|nr:type I restriction-modification system subunit S [Streptococcus pneumoniae]